MMTIDGELATDSAPRQGRGLRLPVSLGLRAIVGLAVVVAAFAVVLPMFATYDQVWPRLTNLDTRVLWILVPVAAFNLVAPSVSQVSALPGLTLRRAVAADWATTTITNLLPGGSVLAIGVIATLYRRWKLSMAAISRSIVVTGVWDVMTKLASPLLAVLWLATERPVEGRLAQAAAFGVVLFLAATVLLVSLLASPGIGLWVGSWLDRLPFAGTGWSQRLDDQRRDTLELLSERGPGLTLWTVVGHANLCLLLVLCLRAVHVPAATISTAAIAAAFTFGRLVTAVPLTPGGLGVMEVGLTGALMAFTPAGVSSDPAVEASVVAAVLLFRLLSYAVPIPLGATVLAWWSATGQGTSDPAGQTG